MTCQLYTDSLQQWLQNQGFHWSHSQEAWPGNWAGAQWLRNQTFKKRMRQGTLHEYCANCRAHLFPVWVLLRTRSNGAGT